ncbi:MAG: hypothetical protein GY765_27015 [bacterium]|nr:hypothetical protein [bacterium]
MVEIFDIIADENLIVFSVDKILELSEGLIRKEVSESLWFLAEKGEVVKLSDKYYIFTEELNKMVNKLKKFKRNQGEMIDIKTFKDISSLSRRYIIALLEYFDTKQITERIENQRKILLVV